MTATNEIFRHEALLAHGQPAPGDVRLTTPRYVVWGVRVILALTIMLAIFVLTASYSTRQRVSGFTSFGVGMVRIVPLRAGRITEVAVAAGRQVQAGTVLFRMDTGAGNEASVQAGFDNLENQISALQSQREAQMAVDRAAGADLLRQAQQEQTRTRTLQAQSDDARQRLDLLTRRRDLLAESVTRGLVSKDFKLQHDSNWISARIAARQAGQAVIESQEHHAQLRSDLDRLQLESAARLDELAARLSELQYQLHELTQRNDVVVRAPVAGKIESVVSRVGQWVAAGTPLGSLQPRDGQLEIRLVVPTRYAARLVGDRTVWLRFAAFPHQRYGLQAARITQISDALVEPQQLPPGMPLAEPSYWATARPARQWVWHGNQQVPLRSGMALTAELVLERGQIYQWLLRSLRQGGL